MAEYIERKALLNALKEERKKGNFVFTSKWIKEIMDDLPTADVVPKSEVARLIDGFQRSIRADAKVGMSAGEILLHINNMLVELKKKYTED